MNKGIFIRIFVCILFLGFCLYSYLNLQTEITSLRIRIPQLTSEVRHIDEENTHLLYKIEKYESPENLMRIAKQSAFSHLKFPIGQEVVTLREPSPMRGSDEKVVTKHKKKPTITFATGANP
ncbi:MAG: Cell division protein FtsL [Chlamydiae bacterium]|nr:Cell division protein FtsL [Chlamydiota bacterium]